jgi:transcriptional regulator with XRE-family HTH domain
MSAVFEEFKAKRKAMKMSLVQANDRCGFPPARRYAQMERGKVTPTAEELAKIKEVFAANPPEAKNKPPAAPKKTSKPKETKEKKPSIKKVIPIKTPAKKSPTKKTATAKPFGLKRKNSKIEVVPFLKNQQYVD